MGVLPIAGYTLIRKELLIAALLGTSASTAASAHHSGAMFDQTQELTLSGTVKDFQWTSPHCWIQLLVSGANGAQEWSVELGPPPVLYRQGWRATTIKDGDQIRVVVNPMKDGSHGGNFLSATNNGGQPIGKPRPPADREQ